MAAGIGQAWNPEWQALARYAADSEHPAAACLRSGRMLVVPGADERLNRALVARFGLHPYTWVFLPLQAAGRPLGTLELGYSETFRPALNEESRANLAAFANQVAIAVHNMQLLRRTDEALARRVAELEKLRSQQPGHQRDPRRAHRAGAHHPRFAGLCSPARKPRSGSVISSSSISA